MAKRGPRPAHERLKRLLVMLPWLMQREEVPVSEMAAAAGVGAALRGKAALMPKVADSFVRSLE